VIALFSMLFNFTLLPLEEIRPWGGPGDLSLHWFGLTDGRYWIQVGASTLLEYSRSAQEQGVSRFCEYQVARLYEDVIEVAAHALEPVPEDLIPHISGAGRKRTLKRMSAWCNKNAERDDHSDYSTVDAACVWIGQRELDTAYLAPSADTVLWSDESMVHIEWDHPDKLVEGAAAWSAPFGSYSLTRSDFLAECLSLHERLMTEMSERIERTVSGAFPPEVRLDAEELLREHERRRRLSMSDLVRLPASTDWPAVRHALKQISR
jgi:hypothetical protein